MLRAITFDFWQTLYKAPPRREMVERRVISFQQILQEMGRSVDRETVENAVLHSWRYAHQYQRDQGLDITPAGQLDCILSYLHLNLGLQEWKRAYDVYTSLLQDHPPQVNEGVMETLPRLAEKYKLGLICNTGLSPGKMLRGLMEKDGLLPWFNFLVFSDEVGWAKPNVKIFNYALENLQVKNFEAAHVGDDNSTDILGAKNAGMIAVWLAPLPSERCTDCDYRVSSISELVDLFPA